MLEGRINQLPSGLLSYFGIKTGGRYPGSLGSELVPVLELFHLYSAQKRRYLTGSLAGIAVNGFSTSSPVGFKVPDAAVWIVTAFRVRLTTPPGGGASFRLAYRVMANPQLADGFGLHSIPNPYHAILASDRVNMTASWPDAPLGGRVFSPGSVFGIDVKDIVTTVDMSCDLDYIEVPF